VSDSHAFEVTVHEAEVPNLLLKLNASLASDSMPVTAAQLHALGRSSGTEQLHISLVLPTDKALSALACRHPELAVTPASVSVGAINLSGRWRGSTLELAFFTTSHDIAAAMRESVNLRAFFRSLTAFTLDQQVREVDEWHESRLL
jgi:hypothetical protein